MNIRQIAYEKYKLDWMKRHGYTLNDLIKELQSCIEEVDEDEVIDLNEIFADWEFDFGFHSEIWACYEEFLENEYQDKEYMREILDDVDFSEYCEEE